MSALYSTQQMECGYGILLLIYNCDACKSFKVGEDCANQMHSFQSVLVFQVVYMLAYVLTLLYVLQVTKKLIERLGTRLPVPVLFTYQVLFP